MIYFDNAATTAPLEEALSFYLKAVKDFPGNSSSTHGLGRQADRELEKARASILESFGLAKTHSLIFNSGATEGNNLAIKGIAHFYKNRGKKLITSSVEHPSVTNAFKELEKEGFEVVYLPVTEEGKVDPSSLEKALDKDTILVSIMGVNNETGAVNDLSALADLTHKFPKAFFHSDLTQAIGKVKVPYSKLDLFTYSSHKIGGLRGDGALIYLNKIKFAPLNDGGGQEYGFRSGTVNVPAVMTQAYVIKEALKGYESNLKHVKEISEYLRQNLNIPSEIRFNSPKEASPYVLNFSLINKKASVVLEALSEKGIYVSSVSACNSKGEPISEVLTAMGKSEGDARNSIRLSFSKRNTLEEAETFVKAFKEVLEGVINR